MSDLLMEVTYDKTLHLANLPPYKCGRNIHIVMPWYCLLDNISTNVMWLIANKWKPQMSHRAPCAGVSYDNLQKQVSLNISTRSFDISIGNSSLTCLLWSLYTTNSNTTLKRCTKVLSNTVVMKYIDVGIQTQGPIGMKIVLVFVKLEKQIFAFNFGILNK